jgi:predicted Zn-dependent protease
MRVDAQQPCPEETQSLTGEAAVAQRAEQLNDLWKHLLNAYQTDNKKEEDAILTKMEGDATHRDVSFSAEDQNKMEELAQRPEVKTIIEAMYNERRAEETEMAYHANLQGGCYFYPNPLLQDYVNKLGQSLVPKESAQFYAFRIVNDPRPEAWSYSTGSVYVSTGLMAMLDNEAQLAYVLAHEIGHVEKRHVYVYTRSKALEELLEVEKIRSIKKKGMILGAIAAGVGGALGGGKEGLSGAYFGSRLGYDTAAIVTNLIVTLRRPKFTDWSNVQENEADDFAAHDTLEHGFDVREAPKVFVTLENTMHRDDRVGMGFHYGLVANLGQRRQHVQTLLDGVLKEGIEEKSKVGLASTSPNFALLMAEVKRDNGGLALEFDLFDEARQNLEQAISLRSNDPTAHLYLGMVYKQTARNKEEEQKATESFQQAIRLDTGRSAYPLPHLERALQLLKQNDSSVYSEAQKEIKSYISLYQLDHGGVPPPGMLVLYDYLTLTGDDSWSAPPVVNVAQAQVQQQPAVLPVDAPKAPVKRSVAKRADINKSN